ncbi:MAG: DUF1446 domain-containing protein [Thermoleophilia bacterium]|nr:DUF1446 domain-containing protein [Thermoleophilia bacterium]
MPIEPAAELRILSTAAFGFRIAGEAWERGLSWKPHAIVAQGTSSDGGPNYLAPTVSAGAGPAVAEDLQTIVESAKGLGIPFIVSTGSPGGNDRQLEQSLALFPGIAQRAGLDLDVAVIHGELTKEYLRAKIQSGVPITRLADTSSLSETLTVQDVDESECIVAQMGPEPIMAALESGADGVVTGRALDVALYAALPLLRGYDPALAGHLAKTIECAGLICVPQSFEPVFGILRKDHFIVRPTSPSAVCTVRSVASHSFYERPDPFIEVNPGGILDLTEARYEPVAPDAVRVSGSRWTERPYTLKIEGIKWIGYRAISLCGIRDPHLIECLDGFLADCSDYLRKKFAPEHARGGFNVMFRRYGKDGVLGQAEPVVGVQPHEIGLLVDIVAPTQELADAICSSAVDFLLHMDFPGRLTTAANVALPFSPREHSLGATHVYNIWHSLPLDDPCEPFEIERRRYQP